MSAEQPPKSVESPVFTPEYATVAEVLFAKYDRLRMEWTELDEQVQHHHASLAELARVHPSDAHLPKIDEADTELATLRKRQREVLDRQVSIENEILRVMRSPTP